MQVKPALLVSAIVAAAVAGGCDGDKEQFSGLSDMVARRQHVRRALSDGGGNGDLPGTMSGDMAGADKSGSEPGKPGKELASGILFEKQIEIVDAQSQIPLAMGVAYLDKQGRIVRIKIIKK